MLTSAQIVSLCTQNARVPGMIIQAGQLLNAILSELCQEQDFDVARGAFNFTFSGAISPVGNLNVISASGPFVLPLDYLRAKFGDVVYFPQGLANLPVQLTPADINEFDLMLQQAGFQDFPVFWVTDMSRASVVLTTNGNSHATTTIDGMGSTAGIVAGMGVAGPGIAVGPSAATTVVSVAASSVVLSQATLTSVTNGGFAFGNSPIGYVWPPASGAYPCLVRYYRQMPDIVAPETSTTIPWFPNQQFLLTELTGRLMQLAGDGRWEAFLSDNEELHPGGSRVLLRRYLQLKDDKSNRAQTVKLDPRKFGRRWDSLPRSKAFGGF